jgi:hypothetical protein
MMAPWIFSRDLANDSSYYTLLSFSAIHFSITLNRRLPKLKNYAERGVSRKIPTNARRKKAYQLVSF